MTVPPAAEHDLLTQAEDALHSLALSLLGVKPWLDKPYTDLPELTPWTRGIGPQARRAHDLGMAIRKHLGLPHRWRTTALGTPPLEAEYVIAAAVAAERERIRQQIGPDRLRKLADWFDTDDEFKTTMFPETWPQRGHELQDDLRAWADLLDAPAPAIPAEGTTP